MDLWDKKDWIKDILSKSGTEIKEVPAEDLRKMVYYTGLPLLMQQADGGTMAQLCFSNNATNDRDGEQSQQHSLQQQQQQQQQRIQFQQQVVNLSSSSSSDLNNHQLSASSTQTSASSNGSPPAMSVNFGNFQTAGSSMVAANLIAQQSPATGSKFRCEQCNINFGSKSAHTSHMKSHAKHQQQQQQQQQQQLQQGMLLEGKVVGKGPVNAAVMAIPGASASADPYQCDVCKKTFAVPARLVRHYRTHTGERPFECEFCHKMFSVKENLQVHRRIHTKERPYKCEICDRAFEHSGKLHRHMRIHTGERPHKCSVCGKTFIQSGQLVIHMRTHTGEKPYKCPVEGCGKGFTCSKQLKVHSRTHTGEKPYHCDICFRDFGYNHVLKLHRVQHYGSKCYKCTICDETFKSKKEMEAHIKGHANEVPEEEDNDNKTNVTSNLSAESSRSTPEYSSSSSNMVAPDGLLAEHPMELEDNLPVAHIDMREQNSNGSSSSNSSSNCSDGNGKDAHFPDGIHYYSQFEQSVLRSYGVQSGVNPALLAAASIAAAATVSGLESNETQSNKSPSPPPLTFIMSPQQQQYHQQMVTSTTGRLSPTAAQSSQASLELVTQQQQAQAHMYQQQQHQFSEQQPQSISSRAVKIEPMAIMKNHGYFAPASQATDFRSSSDIVRQVEAAIAGTESLLTPPRSSPESPDRSSSPESDSVLMANRDNNTLPPRKRRLYFKDQPTRATGNGSAAELRMLSQTKPASEVQKSNTQSPPPPVVRMSSVIQYAKSSYE